MNRHITYISGGERSGKSNYAQKLALIKSSNPVYLATAKIKDSDFAKRVKRHQADRGNCWQTVEESIYISKQLFIDRVVVLDCITLWLANIFYMLDMDTYKSLEFAKNEWNKFIHQSFRLIVVSNELGMGIHGVTQETRDFTQLQGWMNQHIAGVADEAYFLVSGIPMKIK